MESKKTPKHRRKKKRNSNISLEEKVLIKNVFEWVSAAVERERRGEQVFNDSRDKASITAKICNVSRREIFTIRQDVSDNEDENATNEMGRPRKSLDEFDQRALSRLILGYYKRNPPVLPTLDRIQTDCQEIPGFPLLSITTLYRMIKEMGFAVKKRESKMMVYQRMDVVAHRHRYLRAIEEYRAKDFTIYYQDETWCNANHTRQYIWQCENTEASELLAHTSWKGGLKVPCGSGQRLIVNDIGSKDGFLANCREVFVGKKNTQDYHNEMNGDHFENWWVEKVLPAVAVKSVIVIDNAKYHSRITEESKTPTTAWRKGEIQNWLVQRNVPIDEKDTKPILLTKAKNLNVQKEMVLEKSTRTYCNSSGKEIAILRLPIGHSELNPIELLWAQSKNEVARKNDKFNITSVRALMENALMNITPKNWENAIEHVKKVENAFRRIDFGESPIVERMIIEVGGESSSEAFSSNESSYDESDIL